MQLLSNKSATRGNKEPKNLNNTAGTDEKEWAGFGEKESESYAHAPRPTGKGAVGTDTKSEKGSREQIEKSKKRAVSQAKISKNTFEALKKPDEGEDIANGEEGDGKQKRMIEDFLCP